MDTVPHLGPVLHQPQPVAGAVEYRIEGFDAAGEKVPGADDTVKLYLDNHRATGRVDWIKLGGFAPGECGLFQVPAPGSPLTIRFRAMDVEGFLDSYALSVYWGSNNYLPVTQDPPTAHPVAESYSPNPPYRFYGTWEILNPDGYVEVNVKPAGGSPWLPPGRISAPSASSCRRGTASRTATVYPAASSSGGSSSG